VDECECIFATDNYVFVVYCSEDIESVTWSNTGDTIFFDFDDGFLLWTFTECIKLRVPKLVESFEKWKKNNMQGEILYQ
jgi:hypothetical protein